MKHRTTKPRIFVRPAIALAMLALAPFATITAADQPILKPDGRPADQTKKVKVFILMGQSNMVGMGDIQGGNSGWGTAMQKPVSPGYGESMHNIMVIDGIEVFRKEVGKEPVRKAFKFEAGKAYPFKVTYLTHDAGNPGWFTRTDVPGT